jgi:hypothetical protein
LNNSLCNVVYLMTWRIICISCNLLCNVV